MQNLRKCHERSPPIFPSKGIFFIELRNTLRPFCSNFLYHTHPFVFSFSKASQQKIHIPKSSGSSIFCSPIERAKRRTTNRFAYFFLRVQAVRSWFELAPHFAIGFRTFRDKFSRPSITSHPASDFSSVIKRWTYQRVRAHVSANYSWPIVEKKNGIPWCAIALMNFVRPNEHQQLSSSSLFVAWL